MPIDARPQRMSLTDLRTARTFEALSNPSDLEENLKANYDEIDVQGLSHKPQQYSNTDNHTFDLTLEFDAYQDGRNRLVDILFFRRFLLSLFYAPRGAQTIIGGSPVRFLFLWPNFISLTCRIHSARLRHTRFDLSGQPTRYTAEIQIKEVRDVRLTSEDVLFDGTFRSGLEGE